MAQPTRLLLIAGLSVALAGCAADTAPSPTSERASHTIDGTYRYTLTREDAEAGPAAYRNPPRLRWFPWTNTITLEDGEYQLSWRTATGSGTDPAGKFTVDGDLLQIDGFDDAGRPFHWDLTFDVTTGGDLVLTPSPDMHEDDVFVFTTHPWERID